MVKKTFSCFGNYLGYFSTTIFYIYYKEFISNSGSVEFYTKLELYGYCLFVVFVYLLGFFGYKQGNIFTYQKTYSKNARKNIDDNISITNKKEHSNNNETKNIKNEEEAFIDVFYKYMIEQKPYLDSTLSLFQLAKELNVSTHYLSDILNNNIHKNFYEFINYYRVAEVKKRIISNKNSKFTILAIALDSGFNSKATFNRIFKNYTGYTPSQFQKEYK
ncbi:MAG: helix-turn-helix domain-containing protein [Bacteroidales bacterium]|nr:helix-turn-helix domain-containing protein [Bacteroidales bacterium]